MTSPSASIASSSKDNLVEVANGKRFCNRKHKKIYILVLSFLGIIGILFFILFIVYHVKYTNLLEFEICVTEDCIDSSNTLKKIMNLDVDPCQDFYSYTCGNFEKHYPIPDDRLLRSWFDKGEEALTDTVRKVLQSENKADSSSSLAKARNLYASCTNTGHLETLGLGPLYDLLQKLGLPKYPSEVSATDFNLALTIGRLQRYLGMNAIIGLSFDLARVNTESTDEVLIMKVSPVATLDVNEDERSSFMESRRKYKTGTGFSKYQIASDLSAGDILKLRIKFIATVMAIILDDLGQIVDESLMDRNDTMVVKDAVKVLTFTSALQEVLEAYEDDDETNNFMTFADLNMQLSASVPHGVSKGNSIIWKDYLSEFFEDVEDGLWKYDYEKDFVSVSTLFSLDVMVKLLAEYKPVTIQRYIWWLVVSKYGKYTNKLMSDAFTDYLKAITYPMKGISRFKTCTKLVREQLYLPLFEEIKNVQGLANNTEKASEMLQDIKEEFGKSVMNLDWMDYNTKILNIEKAKAINEFIGFDQKHLNIAKIDQYYSDLVVNKDLLLKNLLNIETHKIRKMIMVIKSHSTESVLEHDDIPNPLQLDAFYSLQNNAIYIPAGILQRPFYYRGLESLNYGAIGTIFGHELTHGFDFEGKNYDRFGKMQENLWSKNETEHFLNKAQCFVQQYDAFGINGSQTLSENIADNGGLRESYYAYKSYMRRNSIEPKLLGFESFSSEQLFFISFASIWCEARTNKVTFLSSSDTHSPKRIRVLASLQNMKEFSEAFNCPAEAFMNPKNKCILW